MSGSASRLQLSARPAVNFTLHCSDKSNTSPEVVKHCFYELSHEFKNYYRIFTDGSKEGNRVAAAVVHRYNTKCVRLPNAASIFRTELYALLLAIDVVRSYSRSNGVQFVSSAAVPYFLPLVKYQLSYTRIHACGR